MGGVTHRGNSAWCSEFDEREPLRAAIEHVESFYAAAGLAPSFHISPVAAPAALDRELACRGYAVEAPVLVQTASASNLGNLESGSANVVVSKALSEDWFELGGKRSRFAPHQAIYRGLLSRLGARALYALATVDGVPAATALGVVEPPFIGINSMLTQPEHRGRGLARALLRALVSAALDAGVTRAYLQVERDNRSALAAYARAGFATIYETHYRTLPISGL